MAENELSTMTRRCLSVRRIAYIGTLGDEIAAWAVDGNTRPRGADWRLKVKDARCKLKSGYPKIKV